MKTYIIKRLLLMAVTLFGIALITFVIVQAAPGDPAQARAESAKGGKTQISKKVIEDTRRLYYLDKPIIFNGNPDDRWKIQERLLGRLVGKDEIEEDRVDAANELAEIGTPGLPVLAKFLRRGDVDDESRERLTKLAARLLPGVTPPPASTAAEGAKAWADLIEARAPAYSEERAKALAQEVLAAGARRERVEGDMTLPGGVLVPFLIDAAKDATHPSCDAAQAALSSAARKAWVVQTDEQSKTRRAGQYEAEKREALEKDPGATFPAIDVWTAQAIAEETRDHARKWASFWRDEQDRYLVYEGGAAFLRKLTQTRFARWFGMLLRGDFGESYRTKRPVTTEIAERLPISIQLSLISVFIAYLIAVPLGIHSATRRGSRTDAVLTFGLFLLYSLPTFFVAEMLIIFTTGGEYPLIFPASQLSSASPADYPFGSKFLDWAWHLVLPITVLTYGSFAYISRQMRSGMLEVIRQDYIRTARAKGLSERTVIFKHALRNSLIPILTLLGSVLPHLLSGSVIIEQIFTINGMGKLGFESVIFRDYPVILGISFFSALLTLFGIFLSDLSYALVDPRISYE